MSISAYLFFFFFENNLSISHQSKKNTTSVQAVAHTQMQKILERGGGYGPLPYTLYQTCMMLYKYTCKLLYSKAIVLHVFFPLQKKKKILYKEEYSIAVSN